MQIRWLERQLQPIQATRELDDLLPQQLSAVQATIEQEEDVGRKFMRMFFVFQTMSMDDFALEVQQKAFEFERCYRLLAPQNPKLRVLALMGPGTMPDNAPLDYVLFGQNIQLDVFYFDANTHGTIEVPEHDVAILALGESEKNNPVLQVIEGYRLIWPRPFFNHSAGVIRCARHHLYAHFAHSAHVWVPRTQKLDAAQIRQAAFPFLIRPLDTHAGEGFFKIDAPHELDAFFAKHEAPTYYHSEFVDYSLSDGLFRKIRVALIGKQPYVCHYAIDDTWMVHYQAAHMELSEYKRAEEALFMQSFQTEFASQHAKAFAEIAQTLDLDYVVLDCALAPDGRLLVFEADNRGWIHDTDPVDIFPYKKPVMAQAFEAFTQMLQAKSKAA
jgi:hypothetical protein